MGVLEGDPFYILVNGLPVTKPIIEGHDTVQASLISTPEAAVFTYNTLNGWLESAGLFLGRNLAEDQNLLPKRIVWSRDPGILLPVSTSRDDPGKFRFPGGILVVLTGQLFASLMGEAEAATKVIVVNPETINTTSVYQE